MKKFIMVIFLSFLLSANLLAAGSSVLVDDSGEALGTLTNPLHTTGGSPDAEKWPLQLPTVLTSPPTIRGTASGSTTNAAGYAIGVSTVTLASAGTGTILVGDYFTFSVGTTRYRVTSGDSDVSNGGTISFTPTLVDTIPASTSAITIVSMSQGSATTGISGAVDILPDQAGAFHYLGGPVVSEGTFYRRIGKFTTSGVASNGAVEFFLDTVDSTGRFEVILRGSATATDHGVRLAIQQTDGSWGYATTGVTFAPVSADTLPHRGMVTLGAAGRYKIRLETSDGVGFGGIACGPTDTVTATPKARKTYLIVGDSYGSTISDSGTQFAGGDNYVNQLRYLTGYDFINDSLGGTGYSHVGSYSKFATHLAADIAEITVPIDGVIFAGGYNDFTNSVSASTIATEVAACIAIVRAALPDAKIMALSPWTTDTLGGTTIQYSLGTRDAIRDTIEAAGGQFFDLLSLPLQEYMNDDWSETTPALSAGATSIVVNTAPAPWKDGLVLAGRINWWINIADGANSETRKVTSMGTTDPRTLTVGALTYSHAAGLPITLAGQQYITGTGEQDVPVGDGNADRYIGTDGVHPTVAGMKYIALTIANIWGISQRENN